MKPTTSASANITKACAGCKTPFKTRQFLCCSKCKLNYDLDCASLDDRTFSSMDVNKRAQWECPECVNKLPKCDNTNTPVRAAAAVAAAGQSLSKKTSQLPPSVSAGQSTSSCQNLEYHSESDINSAFVNGFEKLKSDLCEFITSAVDSCVTQLSTKIESLTLACTSIGKRMDTVEERVSAIELRLDQKSCDEPNSLSDTIEQLKVNLNHRDQVLLLNDLEISGLTEKNNENTTNIITLVGSKLGVTIKQRDIVSVMRVGPWRENDDYERPRVLVVRLVRRELRCASGC